MVLDYKYLFFFAISLVVGCSHPDAISQVAEVKRNPDRSMGQQLFFDACLRSDRQGTSLYDCVDPAEMLAIEVPEKVRNSKKGRILIEAGYRQWPPGSDIELKVNVSGVLVDRRNQGGGVIFRIITIEDVDVVKRNGG